MLQPDCAWPGADWHIQNQLVQLADSDTLVQLVLTYS